MIKYFNPATIACKKWGGRELSDIYKTVVQKISNCRLSGIQSICNCEELILNLINDLVH